MTTRHRAISAGMIGSLRQPSPATAGAAYRFTPRAGRDASPEIFYRHRGRRAWGAGHADYRSQRRYERRRPAHARHYHLITAWVGSTTRGSRRRRLQVRRAIAGLLLPHVRQDICYGQSCRLILPIFTQVSRRRYHRGRHFWRTLINNIAGTNSLTCYAAHIIPWRERRRRVICHGQAAASHCAIQHNSAWAQDAGHSRPQSAAKKSPEDNMALGMPTAPTTIKARPTMRIELYDDADASVIVPNAQFLDQHGRRRARPQTCSARE